jgi:hypothetical protein
MDMNWDLESKVEVKDKPKLNTKLITGLLIEQESNRLSGLSLDDKVEYVEDLYHKQKELIPIQYAKALVGDDFSSLIEQGKLSISTELENFVTLEPLCKYLLVSKIYSILDSSTSSEPSVIVKFKPQKIEIVPPQPQKIISETMPEVATEPEKELTLSPSMSLMEKIKYVHYIMKNKRVVSKETADILVDGKVDELIGQKRLKVPPENPGYISVRSLNTYLLIEFGEEAKKAEIEEERLSERLSEPGKEVGFYKLVKTGDKKKTAEYFDTSIVDRILENEKNVKYKDERSAIFILAKKPEYFLIKLKEKLEEEGLLSYIRDLKKEGFNGETMVDLRLPCVFDNRIENRFIQEGFRFNTIKDLSEVGNPFAPGSDDYKAVERFKEYMQVCLGIEKLYEA